MTVYSSSPWSSFDQDNPQDKFIHDYGIYARMYEADGSDYIDAVNIGPNPVGEFRVNGWTDGDQIQPAVAAGGGSTSEEDCHFVITWTGQYMTLETTYTVTTEGEDDDNDTEEEATIRKGYSGHLLPSDRPAGRDVLTGGYIKYRPPDGNLGQRPVRVHRRPLVEFVAR